MKKGKIATNIYIPDQEEVCVFLRCEKGKLFSGVAVLYFMLHVLYNAVIDCLQQQEGKGLPNTGNDYLRIVVQL